MTHKFKLIFIIFFLFIFNSSFSYEIIRDPVFEDYIVDLSEELKINTFSNFKTPGGRGDYSKIKVYNKKINLIDESYNSNPLSLKSAIENYHKIDTKKSQKILLLGDMLELGKHSKKLHQSIAPIINQTKIDKVFVKGKMASIIFAGISKAKKGKILLSNSQIIEMIRKNLKNNDYLMVKASNATGFNKIVENLKGYY